MRTALLAGLLLLGFAAPSFAQMQNGQEGQNQFYQNHDENWHGGPMDHWGHWDHWMHGGRMQGMMAIARELGAGAFYRFKRGNDEVDVHCPPNQPIPECVNAATHLMQALRQNSAAAATGQGQGKGTNQ